MALPPYPSFLIIGFRHNATRWLRFNLDRHPSIYAPPVHPRFFVSDERMAEVGLRGYRAHFTGWTDPLVIGEASWEYTDWVHDPVGTARRIKRVVPDVRLIALVDEPVRRFRSALAHARRVGEVPLDVDVEQVYRFDAAIEPALQMLVGGMPHQSLRPYWDTFGDQLLVEFVDDVRSDPAGVYRRVLRHIGVDDSFVPADIAVPRFGDRGAEPDVDPPSLGARQFLYAWSRDDVGLLAEATGRDLSAWDPGVGPDTPSTEELFARLLELGSSAEVEP
jgi:hypothetical protein